MDPLFTANYRVSTQGGAAWHNTYLRRTSNPQSLWWRLSYRWSKPGRWYSNIYITLPCASIVFVSISSYFINVDMESCTVNEPFMYNPSYIIILLFLTLHIDAPIATPGAIFGAPHVYPTLHQCNGFPSRLSAGNGRIFGSRVANIFGIQQTQQHLCYQQEMVSCVGIRLQPYTF